MVWVGKGIGEAGSGAVGVLRTGTKAVFVTEGRDGEVGVLRTGNNAVFVTEGRDGEVEVGKGALVCGEELGITRDGRGVVVRGCNRYSPVMAIDVRVLFALCISASLAAFPPETTQTRNRSATKRAVIPRAYK